MKKLKLNLDDLKVASFETSKPAESRGTINGQEVTVPVSWCADQSIVTYCPTDCPCQHTEVTCPTVDC